VVTRDESRAAAAIRFQQVTVCPDCGGRGERIDKPCRDCRGTGRVEKEESIKVSVPRGAEEGMALRIPAHGLPSPEPKGAPGDLYVLVTSAPDARFVRNGADLWRSETLAVTDAVLGTTLKVPTLDGAAEVTVPPGAQPGEVLRLRGKGLPVFGARGRGDLNLRIEVQIPEHLSAEERVLYEKLRALPKGTRRSRSS
jgi:molecular chaperone DnaJ